MGAYRLRTTSGHSKSDISKRYYMKSKMPGTAVGELRKRRGLRTLSLAFWFALWQGFRVLGFWVWTCSCLWVEVT